MDDKHREYVSLSQRFQEFADRSADPDLAAAYRALAERYRVLDQWHQTVKNRYDTADFAADTPSAAVRSRRAPGRK